MKGEKASVVNVSGGGIRQFEGCFGRLNLKRFSFAFTLAEVLITLGIIGIVAAMTIPTLVANYQTKSWNTASTVFERKLGEALKVMNTQQTLAGYSNTMDFIQELSKHYKISKICDNSHLDECFPKTFLWGSPDPDTKDITTFTDSSKLRLKPFGTTTVGVQFGDGTVGVLAYDPQCKQDPYSNTIVPMSCIAMLYDTSGFGSPNQLLKDLRAINVDKLWQFKINGTGYTGAFYTNPISYEYCEAHKSELGINSCCQSCGNNDYWGGAVATCGGVSKMPSQEQIVEVVKAIYPEMGTVNTGANQYTYCPKDANGQYTYCRNNDIAISYGFNAENLNAGQWAAMWGPEIDAEHAYYQALGPRNTGLFVDPRTWNLDETICIAD